MGVKPGIYRHYKDKEYIVIGCATHTETGEELVVYRSNYGERRLWARPMEMFVATVNIDGRETQRFTFVQGTG